MKEITKCEDSKIIKSNQKLHYNLLPIIERINDYHMITWTGTILETHHATSIVGLKIIIGGHKSPSRLVNALQITEKNCSFEKREVKEISVIH